MENMFYKCKIFNQPLNKWNISKVKNMINLFRDCKNFNQDLNIWNVSDDVNMFHIFDGASSFSFDENAIWYNSCHGIAVDLNDMVDY